MIRVSIRNPQLNQDALWCCQYPEKSTESLRTIAWAATAATFFLAALVALEVESVSLEDI